MTWRNTLHWFFIAPFVILAVGIACGVVGGILYLLWTDWPFGLVLAFLFWLVVGLCYVCLDEGELRR